MQHVGGECTDEAFLEEKNPGNDNFLHALNNEYLKL